MTLIYLLILLALMIAGLAVGTLIASRMHRRHEATNQDWDTAQSSAASTDH